MFKVTIENERIETKSGVSRRTGRDYSIAEQPAFVEMPNGERHLITIQHEAGDQPLKAGQYQPKDSAGYVGRFGSLEVSTRARHWQPVALAAKQPVKAVA